jgi:hypothetical protein
MTFEENLEAAREQILTPQALALLKRIGQDPKELTSEQIDLLNSKFEKKESNDNEKVLSKKEDNETIESKNQNAQKTETSKEKLKNMEGKELTVERAEAFREVVKDAGIEVEMTKKEAAPVVEATNREFTREIEAEKTLSAFFGKEDPDQEQNRKKVFGEMILMTINEVYEGGKIPEKTFGSLGAVSNASINLYDMMNTIYGHDSFFDQEGRMTPEGVTLLKKVSVTFYELEKKYGSLQKAFEDDRPDNPFYCLKRQEFVPHRLEAFQAKNIWAGEKVAPEE